jgi:hypothetical protein
MAGGKIREMCRMRRLDKIVKNSILNKKNYDSNKKLMFILEDKLKKNWSKRVNFLFLKVKLHTLYFKKDVKNCYSKHV